MEGFLTFKKGALRFWKVSLFFYLFCKQMFTHNTDCGDKQPISLQDYLQTTLKLDWLIYDFIRRQK